MGISKGETSFCLEDILSKVSEAQILAHYLGVTKVPIVINSPLRKDKNPSFGIFSPDGVRIRYKDFATGESGGLFNLLEQMWHCSFKEVLSKIVKDNHDAFAPATITVTRESNTTTKYSGNTKLDVKVRQWQQRDIDYWGKYGINIYLLKYANVYPISHYFITKDGNRMMFGADKLAYAYVEFKEGNTSIKVYQPYNKGAFKWISKHDRSVLGLWTMMPQEGNIICICSSVKDALCLYANTGIPSICLQGEAYGISETAQKVLKSRFKHVCIMLDNDEPGIADAKKLAEQTGFINVELPKFEGGKDISDFFTILQDTEKFKTTIIDLFKTTLKL